MKREVIAQNLQNSLLFKDATSSEIASFAEVARVQIIPEGQYVYRQEDVGEVFFVIAVGEVELVLGRDDGVSRVVGRIGPGGHFGETGILTGKPRSLSVRALCDLVATMAGDTVTSKNLAISFSFLMVLAGLFTFII